MITNKGNISPVACPVCGGDATITTIDNLYGTKYVVECTKCNHKPIAPKYLKKEAIIEWNKQSLEAIKNGK